MGRRQGGHGTSGSPRAPRGRPAAAGRGRAADPPSWAGTHRVLAAAGTGELSLNFRSTLCEPEPGAGAARKGSVGSRMSAARHNRPGGRLGRSAGTALLVGLAGAGAAAGRINGQWEEGDACAPGPGGQGRSVFDLWGLMAAPTAWTPGACQRLAVGLPGSEN